MSGATVSVNPKLGDGTIVQIGGVGFDDFYVNLVAFVGIEDADNIVAAVKARVVPVSAGAVAPNYEQQAQQNVQNAFPNAAPVQQAAPAGAPGPAPIGANGRPKKWVPAGVSRKTGKPYTGFFAEDDR